MKRTKTTVNKIYIHIKNKNNNKEGIFIFINNLRLFMSMRGLKAYEVAKISGISKSYLYDLISGKRINPSIAKVEQIAEALGVNVQDLLSDD